MGILLRLRDKARIHLPAAALVGRDPGFDVLLEDSQASVPHARLRWVDGKWRVHDLASRNGTTVSGSVLAAGHRAVLRKSCIIHFGTKNEAFKLIDTGPPAVVARNLATGRTIAMEDGLLNLPNSEEPLACLRWLKPTPKRPGDDKKSLTTGPELAETQPRIAIEIGDRVGNAVDREVVDLDGHLWQLRTRLASHQGTVVTRSRALNAPKSPIDGVRLTIDANSTLEQITLIVEAQGRTTTVQHHAWHLLLLLLAHERLRDERAERNGPDCGWVLRDELACQRLRIELPILNVQVFRARGYFRDQLKIDNAGDLIERRPGSTELRLGIKDVVLRGHARLKAP